MTASSKGPGHDRALPRGTPARRDGLSTRSGAHAGDLPNLRALRDGTAKVTFLARGASLGEGVDSLLGPDGASIVIHERRDDQRTDPAGNSGARVVCGVVQRR